MAKIHLARSRSYLSGQTYCGYPVNKVEVTAAKEDATCNSCKKKISSPRSYDPLKPDDLKWENIYGYWQIIRPYNEKLFPVADAKEVTPLHHLTGDAFWSARAGFRKGVVVSNDASLAATAEALARINESHEQAVEEEAAILLTAWAHSRFGRGSLELDWPINIDLFGDACSLVLDYYPWSERMSVLLPYHSRFSRMPKPQNLKELLHLIWGDIATCVAYFKLHMLSPYDSRGAYKGVPVKL